MTRRMLFFLMMISTLLACRIAKKEIKNSAKVIATEPTNQVVLSKEIQWEQLNPAREDKSRKPAPFGAIERARLLLAF